MAIKTENVFAAVELLTEMIRLSPVEELQELTHAHDDSPEDRGNAYEARDALLALRNAAAALVGYIEYDLDALTIGLTAGEARRALNEYAYDYDQPIEWAGSDGSAT
jgi:hypothetical protein